MTDVTERIARHVGEYRAAWDAGDEQAARSVLAGVPDDLLDAVLAALEGIALGEGADTARQSGSPDALRVSLEHVGVDEAMAENLSLITYGTFANFVRAAATRAGMGADTVVQRMSDLEPTVEDEAAMLVHRFISEVIEHGDSDLELDDGQMQLLAQALGQHDQTIVALRAQDHGEGDW